MSAAPDAAVTLRVFEEATRRMFDGIGYGGRCACTVRAEADTHPDVPWPAPPAARWCFLCAVEAAHVGLGVHADYFGHALGEVAFDISERRFGLMDWPSRDDVLFEAFDGVDWDQARTHFERTRRRLRSEAAA